MNFNCRLRRAYSFVHSLNQAVKLTLVHAVISVKFVRVMFVSFSDSAGLDPICQLLVDSSEGTVAFGDVIAGGNGLRAERSLVQLVGNSLETSAVSCSSFLRIELRELVVVMLG